MPIMLDSPPNHPETGEAMPLAMADEVRISIYNQVVTYEMFFGKLEDGKFVRMHKVEGRAVHRNADEETGFSPDGPEGPGMYVTKEEDVSFSTLTDMAKHTIDGTEQVGDVITAYDLISENAIYAYEMAERPELFAGTVL